MKRRKIGEGGDDDGEGKQVLRTRDCLTSSYFLDDTKCIESCYPDYTLEDLMGTKNPSENIRIINGSNAREGFVKVKRDKDWGLICYVNQFIVTLICHEFGFQSGRFLRYEDGKSRPFCRSSYILPKFRYRFSGFLSV
jgi:hypothetical protein